METEKLKIFDDNRNHIGEATRADVHRLGLWHEAFHCWFIGEEKGVNYIYLQIRSHNKKDYPNLLDITAAGHLLAHESVQDGVREIKEEIGIEISVDELVPVGVIDYCVMNEEFIDKELANVFLYDSPYSFEEFTLQEEEVSGIVRVKFTAFYELWHGTVDHVQIEGFKKQKDGSKAFILEDVTKKQFVPHEKSYYEKVIEAMKNYFKLL